MGNCTTAMIEKWKARQAESLTAYERQQQQQQMDASAVGVSTQMSGRYMPLSLMPQQPSPVMPPVDPYARLDAVGRGLAHEIDDLKRKIDECEQDVERLAKEVDERKMAIGDSVRMEIERSVDGKVDPDRAIVRQQGLTVLMHDKAEAASEFRRLSMEHVAKKTELRAHVRSKNIQENNKQRVKDRGNQKKMAAKAGKERDKAFDIVEDYHEDLAGTVDALKEMDDLVDSTVAPLTDSASATADEFMKTLMIKHAKPVAAVAVPLHSSSSQSTLSTAVGTRKADVSPQPVTQKRSAVPTATTSTATTTLTANKYRPASTAAATTTPVVVVMKSTSATMSV